MMRAHRFLRPPALGFAVALALGLAIASASQPAAFDPFFFIQLTDPQFGMFTGNARFEQETANLEFAVATANRLKPAFVIITGDLVNKTGDEAQIGEYLRVVKRLDASIPVYSVPGNHDVGNEPTPDLLASYRQRFGPDRYAFRRPGFIGIVVNSCLAHAPQGAPEEASRQERWLRAELASARSGNPRHIVVFQHHPLFLKDAAEPDSYDVIPLARRSLFLQMYRDAGVRYVFGGHYHQNSVARDGDVEVVTTGPIGMPLRGASSGMRIAVARATGIEHRYYALGDLPARVTVQQ